MKVSFTSPFFRQLNKLEKILQECVFERIHLLEQDFHHPSLKTHKLHGKLKNRYSCSVDYKTRIIFQYISEEEILLLAVGNHDVYKY